MEKNQTSKIKNSRLKNLKKLSLLITIVPKGKKEIVEDLLVKFNVNFQFYLIGKGTSNSFNDNDRDIVFSVIRSDEVKDAILNLEDTFTFFKSNQSTTFAVPLNSIVGVQNYLFLSNAGGKKNGTK